MKRSQIKRRPLSDTVLASLEPEAAEYRENDGAGLYFRVKPNGKKSWSFRYKKESGKWSWAGLGSYPALSGAIARKKAAELKEQALSGVDISEAGRARKIALQEAKESTFQVLAEEWLEVRRPGWSEGTYGRAKSGLELHIFPYLGKRPFTDIHPMEWMDIMRKMEAKGILDRMSSIRRHCKEIYDLARVTGRATHNPLEGLSRFLQTKPDENFAHVKYPELPSLLRDIRNYPHAVDVGLGLRLLVLTALRPGEVREGRWEEIDFDKALWTIPATRMKKRREHLVPLSSQALSVLKDLHKLTGGYDLILPGRTDRKKPRSNMVFNMALRRMGYAGRQTGHGFRHIASTILRDNGFSRDYVESQLSHVEGGVSGVYNKATYIAQRQDMMQWYADHLDSLEMSNVVPFKIKG